MFENKIAIVKMMEEYQGFMQRKMDACHDEAALNKVRGEVNARMEELAAMIDKAFSAAVAAGIAREVGE